MTYLCVTCSSNLATNGKQNRILFTLVSDDQNHTYDCTHFRQCRDLSLRCRGGRHSMHHNPPNDPQRLDRSRLGIQDLPNAQLRRYPDERVEYTLTLRDISSVHE